MKFIKRLAILATLFVVMLLVAYLILNKNQESDPMDEIARKHAVGKFIKLSDGITHYQVLGSLNDRTLLFIHGGGVTGFEVWYKNASYFVEHGFSVLLYDLYGRGYSDRLSNEYTPELFNRQLNELLDTLQIQEPISVVSMSMGSMIALDFAAQKPDAIQKLIMIDPAITGDYRANALLKMPVVSNLLMTLYWYPKAIENQRKEFVSQQVFKNYAKRLDYFTGFAGYKHANYSVWMHVLNQNKLPLLGKLKENTVMLIYGTRDPYFPKDNVDLFLKTYPTLKVSEIYDAGHMPHLERATEVNPIILEFVF